MNIEDVLKFVDWLDGQLSSLVFSTTVFAASLSIFFCSYVWCVVLQADERAVLKHFKWPEKKADALREAAIEFRELKQLENEIGSHKDDSDIPCAAALKKTTSLLDK